MNEVYVKTKSYLINEIAANARDVLSAIEGKDPVAVDDVEVLGCCHEIADAMTTLETVAMVAALVPSFLGGRTDVRDRGYRHADWNHRDVDLSIRDNPTGRDLLG